MAMEEERVDCKAGRNTIHQYLSRYLYRSLHLHANNPLPQSLELVRATQVLNAEETTRRTNLDLLQFSASGFEPKSRHTRREKRQKLTG